MRYPVTDEFAIAFGDVLYEQLLNRRQPAAAAVARAVAEAAGPRASAARRRWRRRARPWPRAAARRASCCTADAGKTACALELACRHQDAFSALAFWQAPTRQQECASLADFASRLDIQLADYGFTMASRIGTEASRKAFAPRLRRLLADAGLLLVLDNLETRPAARRCQPAPRRRAGARELARARFNHAAPLIAPGRVGEAGRLLAECQRVFEEHADIPMLVRLGALLAALEPDPAAVGEALAEILRAAASAAAPPAGP